MALAIVYASEFLKNSRRLPMDVRERMHQQVERLRLNPQDPRLHAKDLQGRFAGLWSFRITRNYRVLCRTLDRETIVLLVVDDRKDVYR